MWEKLPGPGVSQLNFHLSLHPRQIQDGSRYFG
jgi:hypothetical protein